MLLPLREGLLWLGLAHQHLRLHVLRRGQHRPRRVPLQGQRLHRLLRECVVGVPWRLQRSNSTFDDLPDTAVGVLGLGEKACNPTCIDPIYSSLHSEVTWADNLFTLCFGRTEGILTIGTYDRRFQNGTLFWTRQRPNELGYTYDVQDMRIGNRTFLDLHVALILPSPAETPRSRGDQDERPFHPSSADDVAGVRGDAVTGLFGPSRRRQRNRLRGRFGDADRAFPALLGAVIGGIIAYPSAGVFPADGGQRGGVSAGDPRVGGGDGGAGTRLLAGIAGCVQAGDDRLRARQQESLSRR